MSTTVYKTNISAALEALGVAVKNDANIPIRSCVRLLSEGEWLTMSATDTVIAVVKKVGATVQSPSDVAVNYMSFSKLISAIKDLPGDAVALLVKDMNLRVAAGEGSSAVVHDFGVLSAADFTEIPLPQTEIGVPIHVGNFDTAVSAVHGFVESDKNANPITTACHIEFSKNASGKYLIKFAATNGITGAAISGMPVDHIPDALLGKTVDVPAISLSKATTILKKDGEENATLTVSDSGHLCLVTPFTTIVITALNLGTKYPDVRQLFPRESPIKAVFNIKQLLKTIRLPLLVDVQGTLTFASNELSIAAQNAGDARASQIKIGGEISGSDITLSLNLDFFERALKGLDATGVEQVSVEMSAPNAKLRVIGIGDPQKPTPVTAQFVLAPMQPKAQQKAKVKKEKGQKEKAVIAEEAAAAQAVEPADVETEVESVQD